MSSLPSSSSSANNVSGSSEPNNNDNVITNDSDGIVVATEDMTMKKRNSSETMASEMTAKKPRIDAEEPSATDSVMALLANDEIPVMEFLAGIASNGDDVLGVMKKFLFHLHCSPN